MERYQYWSRRRFIAQMSSCKQCRINELLLRAKVVGGKNGNLAETHQSIRAEVQRSPASSILKAPAQGNGLLTGILWCLCWWVYTPYRLTIKDVLPSQFYRCGQTRTTGRLHQLSTSSMITSFHSITSTLKSRSEYLRSFASRPPIQSSAHSFDINFIPCADRGTAVRSYRFHGEARGARKD